MKLYFDVKNQIITRTDRNQVIANSSDYLEAEVTFSEEWTGLEKTMTFKNGDVLYTIVLNNDKILQENHLNLGVGTWKVSIQGVAGDQKIVTNESNLAVNASGWVGSEAIPPESVWNQLLVIIESLHTEVASTAALRSAVQKYIEDNYDALVKEEVIVDDVRAALDDMAEDGTLSDLLAPLVAAGMPSVVADQISAVVAAQIGATVASQIGAVVASQITAPVNQAVKDYCDDNFSGWSGALDRGLTQPLMAAPADMVGAIKSALSDLDDAVKYYRIPTSEGTTTATTSLQTVLDNVAIKQGKSYKLTVTIESASDVALYFAYYEHGDPSYKFVMTLDAGSTTKSQNFASFYNITNGYIGATTNNRVVNYSISFEELGEHPTYMEENEQAIEDLSDVVDGVEDEVEALRQTIGIYEPISSGGHMVNGDGNKTILDNLSIVAYRKYNFKLTLKNALDVASYITFWDGTSESYSRVFTLAQGATELSANVIFTFTSDIAYVKFNASNRVLDYTIEFSDVSYEHLNSIQKNTEKIDDLKSVTETVAHNQMITRDITADLTYYVGATDDDGAIRPSETDYVYSEKFDVSAGDVVYMVHYSTSIYRRVTAYYNDTAIPSKAQENVRSYIVPSGVNQLVVTFPSSYSREKEIVVINGYSTKVNSATQQANNALQNFSHMYAKRTPMITFIDDDGNTECYDYLLPIFKRHNVPLVSAYMGDGNPTMKSGVALMSREQCQEIVHNGGEIIVHYVPSLTELSLAEAERIVLQSKDALEKNGFYSRLIVYSNGTSNSAIRAMISKHFDAAFSSGYPRASYTDRSNHDCIPQFAIHRENAGGFYYDSDPASSTLQYFKDMIDECIAANGWLVFVLHSWLMPEGQRDPRWENVDQLGLLEDIIEYVEELQEADSPIRIVTASEGLEHFGNAWQAGDYLGYWNMQSFQSLGTLGDHTEPGSAINKLGQYDFPSVNNLNA